MNGYGLFAVRYARIELPASLCYLDWPDDGAVQDLDFFFWVLKDPRGAVVIDTGFNPDVAAARFRRASLEPTKALDILGVDPRMVSDVIMTHLHYDHAGNSNLFPNARFHVQVAEMAFATGPEMTDPATAHHYAAADIKRFVDLVYSGRVVFHAGEGEVLPGVTLHPVPGHTDGLQVVRIETPEGPSVLASDALHFYASMREGRPFTVARDPAQKLRGYKTLQRLAGTNGRIIAGHDPEVMRCFPDRAGHPDIAHIHGQSAVPLASLEPKKFPQIKGPS